MADTIHVQTESSKVPRKPQQARPGSCGPFIHRCFNQHDEEVASCLRLALMLKKPPSK